ncbi:MAG: TetR/AcrR family transcriptional regulator [Treponema sp.]|nr:TetR/AcrR family transcriptional regulator [Treponema sp.]
MSRKNISKERIIQAFLTATFIKSSGATSLSDVCDGLEIKKASLYNHFENKEAIYDETLIYCEKEINSMNFLADKVLDSIKNKKITLLPLFKRLIARYFNLFETEPTIQVYVFIQTEKYFNEKAMKIYQFQAEKLFDEIAKILFAFKDEEKITIKSDKELKEIAQSLGGIILLQMDGYLCARKDVIRKNPESGAGSLFELPSDDTAVNKTVKLIEMYLKEITV